MASKLFGGVNLSDVAKQVKEKGDPSPYEKLAGASASASGRACAYRPNAPDGGAHQHPVGGSEALSALEIPQP